MRLNGAGEAVVVARGSSVKPTIERIPLPPLGSEPSSITLSPQQASLTDLQLVDQLLNMAE